jgi:hypothetical protein
MDPQALAVVVLAGPAVLAFALARVWTIVLPVAAVPIFYLGLLAGWWGAGVGDGWALAFWIVLALGLAATAAGIALGTLARRLRRSGASAPR